MESKTITQFKQVLKKESLKLTPQRLEVFKEIFDSEKHRESEDIYLALKGKNQNVSRATVYRTMDLLYKYNFVRRMDIGDGRLRYEFKVSQKHHDHLICINCGEIIEFVDPEIEDLQVKVMNRFGYRQIRHIHQLYGICPECQRSSM